MVKYRKRIVDRLLESKLKAFGAVLITGPKGCGKTTTAKQFAKSIIEFQDEDRRDGYLAVANTKPSMLLRGETPILIDEWQDAPKIWGAVRKSVDDRQQRGLYILTGSTSQTVDTPHTGTMRISRLEMLPMSLFESGESNGSVSLAELFDSPEEFNGCRSDLTMDGLINAICRGGWPSAVNIEDTSISMNIARDLFVETYTRDVSKIDGTDRNPKLAEALLKSYSRNICTEADTKTVMEDVRATEPVSEKTFYEYVEALEKLFIIDDVDAWSPAIRSKTAIRTRKKKNLTDPSIAAAALGIGPKYFEKDFKTLGFLFESLCIRDMKIYSSVCGGKVSYYRDRYGLEVDIVIHLDDGRYALCEVRLGENEADKAADNLNKLESLIKERIEKGNIQRSPPAFKMVLTGGEFGYRRDDGVLVIPIGCLRD